MTEDNELGKSRKIDTGWFCSSFKDARGYRCIIG